MQESGSNNGTHCYYPVSSGAHPTFRARFTPFSNPFAPRFGLATHCNTFEPSPPPLQPFPCSFPPAPTRFLLMCAIIARLLRNNAKYTTATTKVQFYQTVAASSLDVHCKKNYEMRELYFLRGKINKERNKGSNKGN